MSRRAALKREETMNVGAYSVVVLSLLFAVPAAAQQNALTRENTREACSDRVDNDGDGLVDCADQHCSYFVFCAYERSGRGNSQPVQGQPRTTYAAQQSSQPAQAYQSQPTQPVHQPQPVRATQQPSQSAWANQSQPTQQYGVERQQRRRRRGGLGVLVAGIVTGGTGLIMMGAGGAAFGVGEAQQDECRSDCYHETGYTYYCACGDNEELGIGLMAAGGTLLTAGIVLLIVGAVRLRRSRSMASTRRLALTPFFSPSGEGGALMGFGGIL